jgi:hypothetical protein
MLPGSIEVVDAQAILIRIDNVKELCSHPVEQHIRKRTLEDRVLDSLAKAFTRFRDPSQATFARDRSRVHIVTDENVEALRADAFHFGM